MSHIGQNTLTPVLSSGVHPALRPQDMEYGFIFKYFAGKYRSEPSVNTKSGVQSNGLGLS
jgi:hypothetical protein